MEDLSADDDILSDILLDNLEFEPAISTHKMNPQYRGQRFDRNTVSVLVRKRIVVEKDISTAIEDLCKIGIVRKYLSNKTPRQISSFHAHARRYFETYLPDSGVEFALTTRYKRVMMQKLAKAPQPVDLDIHVKDETPSLIGSSDNKGKAKVKGRASLDRASASIGAAPAASEKADLCVLALRPFKAGELINYCKGGLKDLSKSEDEALREEATTSREKRKDAEYKGVLGPGRDFSVIRSARKGCSQLLLGPARFVNHDCNPNTDFYRMGSTMLFKVMRPIQRNEEITTYYGDNYFEWANSECMCATCEMRGTGAFSVSLPEIKPKEEEPSSSAISTPSETNGRQRRSIRPSGVTASIPSPSPTPSVTPSWSTTHGDDTPKEKKPKRELLADLKLAEHGPSEDRSDPWAEGAGPRCRCLTCGATFWAPEKWWTPDECPRCERHYKIFKADWPGRVPTEGLLGRKSNLKNKADAESIAEHRVSGSLSRLDNQRSLTPPSKASKTPAPQTKQRSRPAKAVSASPKVSSDRASPQSGTSTTHKVSSTSNNAFHLNIKGESTSLSRSEEGASSKDTVSATTTPTADRFGLDSDGSDLTPEPDSDRDQVFVDDDDDDDEGPRPPLHGTRHGESVRSSSSSPGPTGPKMLGKNAKTDVLAQYWGAPVGDRRVRRKPSATGTPELLALKQSTQDMSRSADRRSSFRHADGEFAGQHKPHQQRRRIATSASDAEDDIPQRPAVASISKHRKTPSMTDVEAVQESLGRKASPQHSTTVMSPALDLSPRTAAARPQSDSQGHLQSEQVSEHKSEGARPELATSGTERTSESNLALFWSAGVGGPRQRRQAQREPINVISPSAPNKRQRQTSESSRSQTPDIKRPRGRPLSGVGMDDDGSSRDRSGRSRSAATSDGDREGSDMDEDDARHVFSTHSSGKQLTKYDDNITLPDKKNSLLPSAPVHLPHGFPRPDLAAARLNSPLAGPPRAGLPGQPMRKNLRWGSGKTSVSRPLGLNGPQGSPLGRPSTFANGPRSGSETPPKMQPSPARPTEHDSLPHHVSYTSKLTAASAPPGTSQIWHAQQDQAIVERIVPSALPLEPVQDIHDIAMTARDESESTVQESVEPIAIPDASKIDTVEAPLKVSENPVAPSTLDDGDETPLSVLVADSQRRLSGRARKAPEMAAGQIPYKGSLVRLAAQRAKNPRPSSVDPASSPVSTGGIPSPDVRESPKPARSRNTKPHTAVDTIAVPADAQTSTAAHTDNQQHSDPVSNGLTNP